jgi:hypothetical protein
MENEEKLLTGEESLKIITEMINKTKTSISQSIFHLLFWGWLIFFCSLSEFILWKFTSFASPWYVWFFVIPGTLVSFIYGFTRGKKETAWTYATMLYVWNWIGFFFAAVVLFIIHAKNMESFSPYILTIAGMPVLMSGWILKFRPLIIGAFTFWIFALFAHYGGPFISALATPAAMITGYLVPGYLLKRKESHDAV